MPLPSGKQPNHLIHETSPYLLQHAYNPVDWYPWGDAALEKARQEDKMLLISIGYAACHWCHVMESESFEDDKVAAYMNQHFVCIKIDREERPDIDQIYMDAVQMLTGRGGWPLNCLAFPDGRPLYGGTYFPKSRWMEFLTYMVDFVANNPDKALQQANQLTNGIRRNDLVHFQENDSPHQVSDLDALFDNWIGLFDLEYGGHQGNIKFALPSGHEFLLVYYALTGNEDAHAVVTTTLDRMAQGGIYDQIGGGFARYSTDRYWKVPHFEKMLYDNAQLVSLYSHAYQLTGKEEYRQVVYETLQFIRRDLLDESGGFYSALDADSEGEEGKYYVWSQEEIYDVLESYGPLVAEYYNVTTAGNWEGMNVLHRLGGDNDFAGQHDLTPDQWQDILRISKNRLLKARSRRVAPALDDKILTSWNGMMLQAFATAYKAFGDAEDLKMALKNGRFILDKMKKPDGGLYRNHKNGTSTINGFLDDYAFVISGFIELYQVTFDEQWLREALQLLRYTFEHFYDLEKQMFYYTSDLDPALVARKMEVPDNVIPSSNSQMARNLFVLGTYLYRDDYVKLAEDMVRQIKTEALRQGPYFSNWAVVLAWLIRPPFEVAVVGKDWKSKSAALGQEFLPFALLSGGPDEGSLELLKGKYAEGKTMIYVCRNKVCQQPVTSVEDALSQMIIV